jgi:CheY-like chemotaxis protein
MTPPVVLVAEDEALVRMLAHEALSVAGFHVLEAAHGREALDILEARRDIALLFSDVDMPQLDGFSLARLVALRWSHIPILITSGKTSPGRGDLPVCARFPPKPYRPSDLIAEITRLLEGRSRAVCEERCRPTN